MDEVVAKASLLIVEESDKKRDSPCIIVVVVDNGFVIKQAVLAFGRDHCKSNVKLVTGSQIFNTFLIKSRQGCPSRLQKTFLSLSFGFEPLWLSLVK